MARRSSLVLAALVAASAVSAQAAGKLPHIPPSMQHVSTVACVKVADDGTVADAFLINSTGDTARDKDVVAWVKQLHRSRPGKAQRNSWVPFVVAIGAPKPEPIPKTCAPEA